jgi:quinol monooxygenase YgiN
MTTPLVRISPLFPETVAKATVLCYNVYDLERSGSMALTVNLYYTGKDGSARRFAEEMVASGIVERVRAQSGNLRYEYFFPMEDPEAVLLIDQWADQTALDIHHKSPMMKEIAALRDKYHLRLRVERYIQEK